MIEYIPKHRLIADVDPNDLEWTPTILLYTDEQEANDNARLYELDDSSYVYRVREVAA